MLSRLGNIGRSASAGIFRQASRNAAARPMTASLQQLLSAKRVAVSEMTMPRTSFSTAAAPSKAAKPEMFCYQCEQTENGTGCTVVGVCGKTPEVAALQDYLIWAVQGVSMYARRARDLGQRDAEVDRYVLRALFSTVTNVNFDPEAITQYIHEAGLYRDKAKAMYESACKAAGKTPEKLSGPANFNEKGVSTAELKKLGETVGVLEHKAERGDDINGVQQMTMYGLKGAAAYAEHALMLGREAEEVYKAFHEVLDDLVNPKASLQDTLGLAMKVGQTNLKVMELLDAGGTGNYGHPEPTQVLHTPVEGKCLLVSGHDLVDLEHILKQTEGKGINVYTHGEMLPAHGYPGLRKYKHLVGHYGGPWQLQKLEFAAFPGSIVVTTNCLVEPRKSYKNRIFTRSVVGWPGVTHIKEHDFTPAIEAALEADGFTKEDLPMKQSFLLTGFARNAVLSRAGAIIDLVKTGKISRFFVIGGCDGSEGERNYFKELALASPTDSLILTLGCGKYRINKLELGNLPGTEIPRVLDMGQCNDAYSAISVASALAKAFNTDVNGLPLSFAVSWFEQKAVAVLLTLLSLGIKNIRLGPHLPGFATPNMFAFLQQNFNLAKIGSVEMDLPKMMKNQ